MLAGGKQYIILSWTRFPQLKWDNTQDELEDQHDLFMTDDRDRYIDKHFSKLTIMMAGVTK